MRNLKKSRLFVAIALIGIVATSCQQMTAGNPQLVVETGRSGIDSVAFSPDGKVLASGGVDKTIKLWDVATGTEIRTLTGHASVVNSVAFSPDGKQLASGGNIVKLWDITTGTEIRTLTEHSGLVKSVVFSPDGKTLAGASYWEKTIKLWDADTGTEIRTLTGHASVVDSVAFSPDGKQLASASGDKTIKLWDVATGTEIRALTGHTSNVISVVFSPDGKTLAGAGATIKLWDVATGTEIHTLPGHSYYVNSVAFSPDSKTLASASWWDKTIKLWDATTGTEIRTLTGHTDHVESVAFSPAGKVLASGGVDKTIKLWDVATGTEIRTLAGHNGYEDVESVAFSPDGKTLASAGSDKTIKLWDAAAGAETRTLTGHTDNVKSVVFSPNGKVLASGGMDKTIKLWDVATGTEIRTLTGHTSNVISVVFSPDGKTLASATSGNGIVVWDVATGTEIRTLAEFTDSDNSVAFSADGKTRASTNDSNNTVNLWDVATGTEIRTLTGHTRWVRSVAFSPDGKTLASAGMDKTIKLWNVATGTEIRTLTGHTDFVNSGVAFSPDGKTLASAGVDDTIKLWDVATGAEIRTLTGQTDFVKSLAFSPDGKTLTGATSGGTIVWDVASGTKIRTLTGHNLFVTSVAFSRDGKTLASGTLHDNTVKLWDAATGAEIRTLTGHNAYEDVESVAFSPDGKTLASAGVDDTIKLWDVTTGTEIRTLTGDNLFVKSVAFSPDGKTLAGANDSNNTVKLWDVATGAEIRTLTGQTTGFLRSLAFSPDGKTLAGASTTIKLWDVAAGGELVSMVSFNGNSWVIVAPDGHFDTNRIDDIKGLHWLMPDAPLTPLPIEIFMRDYYEPKLLSRVLAREKFKSVRDFSTLNRTQPEVKIVDIAPDSSETVQVTVEVASVNSVVQTSKWGFALESGVYDVRLFRGGQLVGYAPANDGKVPLSFFGGKATLKFPNIKWPRTGIEQVEFSAYAFNADRIKSATDRKIYSLRPQPTPIKGRAYVIGLGVNAYEREGLNLRYAANDARQVQKILELRLGAQGEFEEVVSLQLVSDYAVRLANGRTVVAQDAAIQEVKSGQKRITENNATKAHLRAVLDVLAGRQADAALLNEILNADKLRGARPEDLVLISVSTHGYTDSEGVFYIVPSDTGSAAVSSPEFRQHCISSDELSRWLRDVDAGELVMIVDACHSTAAVEGTDFKPGPMGSRGLGQLSYDKGMRILTATQTDNVALEDNKVRQGLLMYALLQDGLGAWRADYKPKDNSIMLTEWLGYAVERVPRLYKEVKAGAMQVSKTGTNLNDAARIIRDTVDPRESDNDKTQQPSLFDFAPRRREVVLACHP